MPVVDFAQQHLYGLFANRRAALQMLQSLLDEQRLCYGLLGLEPLSRGRACSLRAGPLRGATVEEESVGTQRRLLAQGWADGASWCAGRERGRGAGGARPGR